jgi:RHS repeat-associated protein
VNVADDTDVLLEAEYSAFGERSVIAGDGSALSVGFAGGEFDVDSGLVRFGARDYDASIGRWVSKDPIGWEGGQVNLYVYAGQDPGNHLDPSGLWTLQLGGQFTICLGICATINPNIACDADGNFDLNISGSLAVSSGYAGVSLGPTIEVTNASGIDDLTGVEGFVGGSASGEVAYVGAGYVEGESYWGVNASAGVGGGWGTFGPAEVHVGGTVGVNVAQAVRHYF